MHRLFAMACTLAGSVLLAVPQTWAQSGQRSVGGVYTCIDSHGRRLSSDRPIPECADREQRVLGSSGVERGRIGPSLTDQERQQQQEARRQQLQEERRLRDQRRRDELLMARFPNRPSHDLERQKHMAQFDDTQALARVRLEELERAYFVARQDMRPYLGDPSKAPASLRNALEDATQAVAMHKRTMEVTEINRQRAILRLDDELSHLEQLWQQRDQFLRGLPAAEGASPGNGRP